jgi:DNA-binding MarR family transcriptional regulator
MKPARPATGVDTGLLDGLIGYHLRRTTHAVTADFTAAFEGMKLRPILFAVMAVIAGNPGIIQMEVGKALDIHRANLVPLLKELDERGLIVRRIAAHDRRAFALDLTHSGKSLFDEALGRMRQHESRFFGVLTARERDALRRILLKLARD